MIVFLCPDHFFRSPEKYVALRRACTHPLSDIVHILQDRCPQLSVSVNINGNFAHSRIGCVHSHCLPNLSDCEGRSQQNFILHKLKHLIGNGVRKCGIVVRVPPVDVVKRKLLGIFIKPDYANTISHLHALSGSLQRSRCDGTMPAILDLQILALMQSRVLDLLRQVKERGHGRGYSSPSTECGNPLAKAICFLAAAGEITNCEGPKKQKDEQHSRHSERNVPAQPIASIASSFHVLPPLAPAWTIGDSARLLQWGRA